ncbi:MAG: hypothetical protein ACFCBW_08620, partial [Candidatus Competibacterales bacterium]
MCRTQLHHARCFSAWLARFCSSGLWLRIREVRYQSDQWLVGLSLARQTGAHAFASDRISPFDAVLYAFCWPLPLLFSTTGLAMG